MQARGLCNPNGVHDVGENWALLSLKMLLPKGKITPPMRLA